jgi:hypothetical protein
LQNIDAPKNAVSLFYSFRKGCIPAAKTTAFHFAHLPAKSAAEADGYI